MLLLKNLVPVRDSSGRFTGMYRRREHAVVTALRFWSVAAPWILLAAFVIGHS